MLEGWIPQRFCCQRAQAFTQGDDVAFAVGVNTVAHKNDESFGGGIYPNARTGEAGMTEAADGENSSSLTRIAAIDVPSQTA